VTLFYSNVKSYIGRYFDFNFFPPLVLEIGFSMPLVYFLLFLRSSLSQFSSNPLPTPLTYPLFHFSILLLFTHYILMISNMTLFTSIISLSNNKIIIFSHLSLRRYSRSNMKIMILPIDYTMYTTYGMNYEPRVNNYTSTDK